MNAQTAESGIVGVREPNTPFAVVLGGIPSNGEKPNNEGKPKKERKVKKTPKKGKEQETAVLAEKGEGEGVDITKKAIPAMSEKHEKVSFNGIPTGVSIQQETLKLSGVYHSLQATADHEEKTYVLEFIRHKDFPAGEFRLAKISIGENVLWQFKGLSPIKSPDGDLIGDSPA